MAAPFLGWKEMEPLAVVHLVRNPQDTLNSMLRMGGLGHEAPGGLFNLFALRYLPEAGSCPTAEEQIAFFYLRWNEMVEAHADFRWRVEDDVRGLLDLLGIDHQGKELFSDTAHNTSSTHPSYRECAPLDLNALPEPLRSELREMSERYGYA